MCYWGFFSKTIATLAIYSYMQDVEMMRFKCETAYIENILATKKNNKNF